MTTQDEAFTYAASRLVETGQAQAIYQSQPGHFLYCSVAAYRSQYRLTPNLVKVLGLEQKETDLI